MSEAASRRQAIVWVLLAVFSHAYADTAAYDLAEIISDARWQGAQLANTATRLADAGLANVLAQAESSSRNQQLAALVGGDDGDSSPAAEPSAWSRMGSKLLNVAARVASDLGFGDEPEHALHSVTDAREDDDVDLPGQLSDLSEVASRGFAPAMVLLAELALFGDRSILSPESGIHFSDVQVVLDRPTRGRRVACFDHVDGLGAAAMNDTLTASAAAASAASQPLRLSLALHTDAMLLLSLGVCVAGSDLESFAEATTAISTARKAIDPWQPWRSEALPDSNDPRALRATKASVKSGITALAAWAESLAAAEAEAAEAAAAAASTEGTGSSSDRPDAADVRTHARWLLGELRLQWAEQRRIDAAAADGAPFAANEADGTVASAGEGSGEGAPGSHDLPLAPSLRALEQMEARARTTVAATRHRSGRRHQGHDDDRDDGDQDDGDHDDHHDADHDDYDSGAGLRGRARMHPRGSRHVALPLTPAPSAAEVLSPTWSGGFASALDLPPIVRMQPQAGSPSAPGVGGGRLASFLAAAEADTHATGFDERLPSFDLNFWHPDPHGGGDSGMDEGSAGTAAGGRFEQVRVPYEPLSLGLSVRPDLLLPCLEPIVAAHDRGAALLALMQLGRVRMSATAAARAVTGRSAHDGFVDAAEAALVDAQQQRAAGRLHRAASAVGGAATWLTGSVAALARAVVTGTPAHVSPASASAAADVADVVDGDAAAAVASALLAQSVPLFPSDAAAWALLRHLAARHEPLASLAVGWRFAAGMPLAGHDVQRGAVAAWAASVDASAPGASDTWLALNAGLNTAAGAAGAAGAAATASAGGASQSATPPMMLHPPMPPAAPASMSVGGEARCAEGVALIYPLAEADVADAAVAGGAHPIASFPALWEAFEDAGVLAAGEQEDLNVDFIRVAAEEGDPGAAAEWGQLLMQGRPQAGLAADPVAAERFLEAAADAGNADARAQLGMLLLERALPAHRADEVLAGDADGAGDADLGHHDGEGDGLRHHDGLDRNGPADARVVAAAAIGADGQIDAVDAAGEGEAVDGGNPAAGAPDAPGNAVAARAAGFGPAVAGSHVDERSRTSSASNSSNSSSGGSGSGKRSRSRREEILLARQHLERAAAEGSAQAHAGLGYLHMTG